MQRKEWKITQDQSAEAVGIAPKNISPVGKGNNSPTAENLTFIANALEGEIYELFAFNEIPYSQIKKEIIDTLGNEKTTVYLYNCLKFEK